MLKLVAVAFLSDPDSGSGFIQDFVNPLCGPMSVQLCTCPLIAHSSKEWREAIQNGALLSSTWRYRVKCSRLVDRLASIADSGPALNQHWVFDVNRRNPLNAIFHH